ncbi:three-helix bundle dimerization domain-containing protein [Actinosynnema sp. NPDC020468]|uniref:three-helix bundle dimerization domain-containing protein n=1 Tax=Actinosynnema sp. NPDC020468 TaxID=3154488 RepID=UPI0033EDF40A
MNDHKVDLDNHLAVLDERLVEQFPEVPADAVRQWRREESNRLAAARITAFVPILVERAVRRRIGEAA